MKKIARATRQRKERQAEARYVASLRRRVTQYECYGDPAEMSKERMEAIIQRGKRRHVSIEAFMQRQFADAEIKAVYERLAKR